MAALRNVTGHLSIVKTFQIMPIGALRKLYIDTTTLYKLDIDTVDPLLSHRGNGGIFDLLLFFSNFYWILENGV